MAAVLVLLLLMRLLWGIWGAVWKEETGGAEDHW